MKVSALKCFRKLSTPLWESPLGTEPSDTSGEHKDTQGISIGCRGTVQCSRPSGQALGSSPRALHPAGTPYSQFPAWRGWTRGWPSLRDLAEETRALEGPGKRKESCHSMGGRGGVRCSRGHLPRGCLPESFLSPTLGQPWGGELGVSDSITELVEN